MTRRHLVLHLAVASLVLLISSSVFANTIVDLRFAPGQPGEVSNKLVNPVANTDYTIQVWAQVFGANTLSTDDGLQVPGYGNLASLQVSGGGALVGAGGVGITANTGHGLFTDANPFGQPGLAHDYNQ